MNLQTALAALILTAGSASAESFFVYSGAELEFTQNEDGIDSGLATYLRGYLEVESNGFYAGVKGKAANDSVKNRVDPYLGYRGELKSGLTYDVGYYRYLYTNDSASNYGELYLSLGLPVNDKLTTTLDLAYDPANKLGNAYIGASFAATDKLSLSANYGSYEVADAPSESEWDLGASWSLSDEAKVDLRYYDGTEYETSYVGLKLSVDTTVFSR